MSRFSLVGVMNRLSGPTSDEEMPRPSVISSSNLNKQLTAETKQDLHLFFGPQDKLFEGKERTRVLHGERKIVKNARKFWLMSEPLSMEKDSTSSLVGFPTEAPKSGTTASAITSTLSAAGRFLGQKVVAGLKMPASHVNEDSFCDGCGMDPIIGNMYTCSTCENYHLCEGCYQTGVHGYEDSDLLRNVREDFALRNIVETCRNRVPEKVFELLMKVVCKGQVDKFKFLARWITAVVLGYPLNKLAVRGIEIPRLDQETRTTLVALLTPVLAERTDLEVCMEWFCPDADREDLPGHERRLETMRIWVATDDESASPFKMKTVSTDILKDSIKDSIKDDDTESDGSHSSGSVKEMPGSPVQEPFSPSEELEEPMSPLMPPSAEVPTDLAALSLANAVSSDSDCPSEASVIEPKAVTSEATPDQASDAIQM